MVLTKIDPKVDFAFKWLFGQERNIPLLVHLLNAVLRPTAGSEIVALELLNPFNEQDAYDDKLSIVDVKARDLSGRHFDVEMQLLTDRSFSKRILYYWADLHQQQLKKGDDYFELRPTISVCITDFPLFPTTNDYFLTFELRNREHDLVFDSDIMIVILELSKFKLEPDKIVSSLDAWLYFLSKAEELDSDNLPQTVNTPEIRKALEELSMLSHDDLERERYKARIRVLRDERSRQNHMDELKTAAQEAEQRLQEAEKRLQKAEAELQETDKRRQEAEQRRQEAEQRQQEAEQRRQEAEQRRQEAEAELQETEKRRKQSMGSLVIRFLNRRFGHMKDATIEQIQNLKPEQIELLSESLLDFSNEDDLVKWLPKPRKIEE